MNKNYKYFAFISFQSSDAKEAIWVQKAIESYRLPTAVSKQNRQLPKKMRPCFCYLNDINLSEELMQELKLRMEQSEYLIVICSPRSAKSTFVNGGIDYFISLGGRDRIIPLIVDGIPYSSDPAAECFPEALRRHFPKSSDPMQDHQILGVNINEEGAGSKRWKRQRAVLMVIARMLGLEFENLWNREVKRKRKRRILITLLSLMVCFLIATTWHFSRSTEVKISLKETTPENTQLPALKDGSIKITLQNEDKQLDSLSINDIAVFKNIPRKFIGRTVQLAFKGTDYLPIDTNIVLKQNIELAIERDANVYGHIKFRLRTNNNQAANISIANHQTRTDSEGYVELDIPLEQQACQYAVFANEQLLSDSLYMPCGENVILIMN